ncbi:unnamed protein product [Dovyalis caffra]|uniref:Uncharacterized protein n=1 Tax=Dovyalis caffra TaxID=77055 RepID=A0AAV1RGM2_9ROSI|nr:unnamed protein product [Dovyalis caffra]
MAEISQGQKRIREGQKEVREKFREISEEAAKLQEETNLISKQSAANQLRLDLMFEIVKARTENDSAKDASLTQTLRELMAKQKHELFSRDYLNVVYTLQFGNVMYVI